VLPAATLLLFLSFLMANARIQNKRIRDGIALRLRTESLVDELRLEKQESDRQRTRAEQANLAKSHFLAAASHDLRQPLHAVGLFSASLREVVRDDDARAIVDNISESVESLESLFIELLDLSQLEAGSLQIKIADFPIEPLLSRLRTRFGPLATERRLALDIPACQSILRSDAVQLERLLGNLLANAIQYTDRGTVRIACTEQENEVRVEVRDTGIGIPQQYRERIFDALFQIGNPERDRRKGRGLGLAIVRRLSDMLGHRIEVASEEGAGSTFSIVVPAGDAARVQEQPAQTNLPTDLLRGRSVLVVDDEPSVRAAMQELLARWGCRAYCAADHAQALTIAGELPLDFIIADLRLGGGAGGGEVIHAVRSVAGSDIGALLVTGDTSADAVQVARHQRCALLHKPVSPARLRSVLTHLAASRLA
jgi:signal transduction histidine kinase/CheY-like chemotaxis protein